MQNVYVRVEVKCAVHTPTHTVRSILHTFSHFQELAKKSKSALKWITNRYRSASYVRILNAKIPYAAHRTCVHVWVWVFVCVLPILQPHRYCRFCRCYCRVFNRRFIDLFFINSNRECGKSGRYSIWWKSYFIVSSAIPFLSFHAQYFMSVCV